jgi:hypothetical protein
LDDERACRSTLLLLDERNSDGGVRRAWQAVLFAAKRAAPGWGGTGAGCMLNVLGLEPWVVAEQPRHSDGGTLLVLAVRPSLSVKEAINRDAPVLHDHGHAASGDEARADRRCSGESRGNGLTNLAIERACRSSRTLPLRWLCGAARDVML